MLSLSNGGMSAGHAARYFSREDYYLQGGEPSRWIGKASEHLHLEGEVKEEDFRKVCQGEAPDGTRLVAHKITREEGAQVGHHRAGNDLTFSAPKSVSVGYAAGNRELKEIWDQAVANTVKHVEDHYSNYRTRDGVKSSGNIVAAKFDHVTSRSLDPEVHSHVFLVNMTRVPGSGGKWKANEPKNIYTDKITIGMLARQEAIHLYRKAGYPVYFTNRAQLLFEVEGVSPRELDVFSKRSAAIAQRVARWKEEKRFPGVSEGVLKQMAALDTRDPKRGVTKDDVRREWDRGFEAAGTTAREVRERIEAARELARVDPPLNPAEPIPSPPVFRYLAPGAYPPALASVLPHTNVVELKKQPGYQEAKRGADLDSARRVVQAVFREDVLEEIKKRLPEAAQVYVVPVTDRDGPRKNRLPLAYAERLARELGGQVWDGVVKVAGGHNTGTAADQRLHNRPEFSGPLPPKGSAIIVADDAFTVGGTVAGVIDHLAREGNPPVCATVLASGRYGEEFAPTPRQIEALLEKCGVGAGEFEADLGYPPRALTGSEIRCYLRNGSRGLDGARARFFAGVGAGQPPRGVPASCEPSVKSARAVVRQATEFLTGKEAVIDRAEIIRVAAQISGGAHSIADLNGALDGWAGRRNGIERMGRETRGWQAGKEFYTTYEMRQMEARNIERLKNLGAFSSVTSRDEVEAYLAQLAQQGITLAAGQKRHIVNELTGTKGFSATQGDPGTGKTFSADIVERFNREVLEPSGRNHRTINLAYTGKAALEMSQASGRPALTIDSFLNSFYNGSMKRDLLQGAGGAGSAPRQVQVVVKVDEASLVGARQAGHLLQAVEDIREKGVPIKLVVIGDRKQMPSIQASPFFTHASGLARQGLGDYAELKEIGRQQDRSLLKVAEALNRETGNGLGANAQVALDMLESQGRVSEIWDRKELVGAAVSHYLAESEKPSPDPARAAAGEHKTVLLVTPLNLDREELNLQIREVCRNSGRLGPSRTCQVLSQVRQEVTVSSLQPGMVLVFNGERGEDGRMHPVPGTYLSQQGEIQSVDPERNTATVRLSRGDDRNLTRTFDASRFPGSTTLYRREEREFAPGDRLVFGKSIHNRSVTIPKGEKGKGRGVRNGEMGEIVALTGETGERVARVRLDGGRCIDLQLDRYGPQVIDHGYAVTVYKGQGGTVDSVIPFHYVKPGIENDQKVLEALTGQKLTPAQFRLWNSALADHEKEYRAPVTIGGHRGELGFLMIRAKESGREHKGIGIRFFDGPAVIADREVRSGMRHAGMYWSPGTGTWVAAAANDRALALMDRHPLRDPGYTGRLRAEGFKLPGAGVGVERTCQAEIDTKDEAEKYGRASFNAFNVAVTRARHDAMVFTNSVAGLKQAVLSVDEKTRLEHTAQTIWDSRLGEWVHSYSDQLSRTKLVRLVLEYGSRLAPALKQNGPISGLVRLLSALWSRARSRPGTLAGMVLLQVCLFVMLCHLQFTANLLLVPAPFREFALKWPVARLERAFGWNGRFHLHSSQDRHWWNNKKTRTVTVRAKELAATPYSWAFSAPDARWGLAFLLASPVWLLFFAALWESRRVAHKMEADQHIRGGRLCTEQELAEACSDGILYVGTIRISEEMSRRHLLIVGQSGSGKTYLTVQHLVAIQRAGRRAVVNDFKGYLVERFYRKDRDLILNPLDKRGIKWTIFNDIRTRLDLASMIGILIPLGKGNELFWTSAARDVLRGIFAYCYKFDRRTNADLCAALRSPIEEIAKMCLATEAGWAGYRYLHDPRSKMAEGIIAVLTAYVNWLDFAPDGDFSLREWVETRGGATIYMTSLEEAADIMKPYLSLVTDLVVKRLLSLPEIESPDDSIYLLLDELSNMHRLSSVTRLITAGRSKGVVVEVGIQDMSGVVMVYGQEETKTIINNCGSKMILNLGEPGGADLCSELCGTEDYWQSSTTYTIEPEGNKVTETHSRQQSSRRVVMPTEIMRLSAGRGYFMFSGGNPASVRVPRLRENVRQASNKKLLLREGLSMKDLKVRNDEIVARAREVMEGPVPPEMEKIHEQIDQERKPEGAVLVVNEVLEIDCRNEIAGKE